MLYADIPAGKYYCMIRTRRFRESHFIPLKPSATASACRLRESFNAGNTVSRIGTACNQLLQQVFRLALNAAYVFASHPSSIEDRAEAELGNHTMRRPVHERAVAYT
eukprot:GILK01014718.1.p1 GENE.GILK01014718.1~~GILK01014718.1.p1  ORF type:complete len:107 (-),score=0.53 GILK01014718.1:177-497(-)